MQNLSFSGRGETYVPTNRQIRSRSFQVNPVRETNLYGPGDYRLTIPPQTVPPETISATNESLEMQVQLIDNLQDLFATGLHTCTEGKWMGLHKVIQVRNGGKPHQDFHPALTLDLKEPHLRRQKIQCQLYGWQDSGSSQVRYSGWVLRKPKPLARFRSLGESYHRVPVHDNSWMGFLFPIEKEEGRCMITVKLDAPIPPQQVKMYVRLHGVSCFGPVYNHGDRWGATGLPAGFEATVFAIGKWQGNWTFGQTQIYGLRSQRLQLEMTPTSEIELATWLQKILG